MYTEIQNARQLPKEEALTKLEQIEAQIHVNISEIKDSTFVHCGNLDPDSCRSVHNVLLREVERTRKLIQDNEV